LVYFDIQRAGVLTFTLGLPVFWAILLAAGDLRRSLRPLAIGTVLMAAVETLMLLVLVWLGARKAAARMVPGAQDTFGAWLINVGEYVVGQVLPYVAPFVIALALHPGLRSQILPFAAPVTQKTAAASVKNARSRRRQR
jgi:hypothetical protein